jgi:hypothetical protein
MQTRREATGRRSKKQHALEPDEDEPDEDDRDAPTMIEGPGQAASMIKKSIYGLKKG